MMSLVLHLSGIIYSWRTLVLIPLLLVVFFLRLLVRRLNRNTPRWRTIRLISDINFWSVLSLSLFCLFIAVSGLVFFASYLHSVSDKDVSNEKIYIVAEAPVELYGEKAISAQCKDDAAGSKTNGFCMSKKTASISPGTLIQIKTISYDGEGTVRAVRVQSPDKSEGWTHCHEFIAKYVQIYRSRKVAGQ